MQPWRPDRGLSVRTHVPLHSRTLAASLLIRIRRHICCLGQNQTPRDWSLVRGLCQSRNSTSCEKKKCHKVTSLPRHCLLFGNTQWFSFLFGKNYCLIHTWNLMGQVHAHLQYTSPTLCAVCKRWTTSQLLIYDSATVSFYHNCHGNEQPMPKRCGLACNMYL